jgi:hypothetical protein
MTNATMPVPKDTAQQKKASTKAPDGDTTRLELAIARIAHPSTQKTRDAVAHQIRVGLSVVPFSLFIIATFFFSPSPQASCGVHRKTKYDRTTLLIWGDLLFLILLRNRHS